MKKVLLSLVVISGLFTANSFAEPTADAELSGDKALKEYGKTAREYLSNSKYVDNLEKYGGPQEYKKLIKASEQMEKNGQQLERLTDAVFAEDGPFADYPTLRESLKSIKPADLTQKIVNGLQDFPEQANDLYKATIEQTFTQAGRRGWNEDSESRAKDLLSEYLDKDNIADKADALKEFDTVIKRLKKDVYFSKSRKEFGKGSGRVIDEAGERAGIKVEKSGFIDRVVKVLKDFFSKFSWKRNKKAASELDAIIRKRKEEKQKKL
jgi:hypothetical protein